MGIYTHLGQAGRSPTESWVILGDLIESLLDALQEEIEKRDNKIDLLEAEVESLREMGL